MRKTAAIAMLAIAVGGCSTCNPNRYSLTGAAIGLATGGVSVALLDLNPQVLYATVPSLIGFKVGGEIDKHQSEQRRLACAEPGPVEEPVTVEPGAGKSTNELTEEQIEQMLLDELDAGDPK